jgi:protein SCO1/2
MTIDAPSEAAPAPRARRTPVVLGTSLLAAAALAAGLAFAVRALSRRPEPPRYATVPDFALVERTGRPLGLRDLRGRVWIADFIFTKCGGACPAMTARMARLRRDLPAAVTLVSFSVDPATDTPEALTRYAATFQAGPDWLFVTGPQPALFDLSTSGFKLAAMEVPEGQREAGGDGPFLHSSKFVLVDGEAAIRGYYDSTDEEAMRGLAADAAALTGAR